LYQTLLSDSRFYLLLLKIDKHIAEEFQSNGCHCGGKLHRASYPRKPRGVPNELQEQYSRRHSFCCDQEGCRHRATPFSFCFLGRRVFVSAVVILVSALHHGLTPKRLANIRELVGVSPRTVNRWRLWWREDFVRTSFWKAARGFLSTPVDESSLPLSLLEGFPVNPAKRKLLRFLRFICPLTANPSGKLFDG
jgi:hypothetical protein